MGLDLIMYTNNYWGRWPQLLNTPNLCLIIDHMYVSLFGSCLLFHSVMSSSVHVLYHLTMNSSLNLSQPSPSAPQWKFQSVPLPSNVNIFKIELTATVGGNKGDIAIDDLKFSGMFTMFTMFLQSQNAKRASSQKRHMVISIFLLCNSLILMSI